MATVKAEDVFEPHLLAKYDPEVVTYVLKGVAEGATEHHMVPIEEVRANPASFTAPWLLDTTGWERTAEKVVTSEDGADIPVRVYYPDPKQWGEGPYGVHLNFHGKGVDARRNLGFAY